MDVAMTSQSAIRFMTLLLAACLALTGCKDRAPAGGTGEPLESDQAIPTPPKTAPCPEGMVHVPAGSFVSGATGEAIDFYPDWPGIEHLPRKRQTRSTGEFCIDRLEYPNVEGDKPRAYVSWDEARALCRDRGSRLCTEDEWSKACGGEQGWLFPYGDTYQTGLCNADVTEGVGEARWIRPAGDFPRCESPCGALDMEGNLSEWVDAVPDDDDPELRIVRGGTMWVGVYGRGCMARHRHHHTDASHEDDGFRCCSDPG